MMKKIEMNIINKNGDERYKIRSDSNTILRNKMVAATRTKSSNFHCLYYKYCILSFHLHNHIVVGKQHNQKLASFPPGRGMSQRLEP